MEDSAYYLQAHGAQVSPIQYVPQTHPAYAGHLAAANQHILDYPGGAGQGPQSNYHPNAAQHYAGQLHPNYHQGDSYQQQQFHAAYDCEHPSQLNQLPPYYGTPGGIGLATESNSQPNGVTSSFQNPAGYSQYAQHLQAQSHYQQNLGLDPNGQPSNYPYHPHLPGHHGLGQQALDQANYMAFGQAGQNGFGPGYLSFNPQVHNSQLHPSQYGLIQSAGGQLGIIDPNLTGPVLTQQQIGKSTIKSEEQAIDNEMQLLNSLGDSHSQNEDKLKVNQQYLLGSPYDQQQQAYPTYYLSQGAYFQGYPPHFPGQQLAGAQITGSISNPASSTHIKDKNDPTKQQPNSPGRKKTIKKGSPTTEPSSPTSPKGRKRKNTLKAGEQPQPESSSTLNPQLLQAGQMNQPQFGLTLMRVPNQEMIGKQQFGFPGQHSIYSSMQGGQIGGMQIDPNTQQITGIDPSALNRMSSEYKMNEFGLYEDPKQIGTISKEERLQKIRNYQDKRNRRSWNKKISYDVRKKVADGRLRVKGRFVTKVQALEMLELDEKEEKYTMDQLKEMLKQRHLGDDNSNSPRLNSCKNFKKSQSMPGTQFSLKQGDEEDEEGNCLDSHENLSENIVQLGAGGSVPIIRRKSCDDNRKKDTDFLNQPVVQSAGLIQNQQITQEMSINDQSQAIANPTTINHHLHLKLEQKENDTKQIHTNILSQQQLLAQQGQIYQLQQQQQGTSQVFSTSQSSTSRSPSRSPRKLQTESSLKLVENIISQSPQMGTSHGNTENQGQLGLSEQEITSMNNGLGSMSNIINQEIAEQLTNLNIKSPDLKHTTINAPNKNLSLLNLTDTTTGLTVHHNHQQYYQGQQQQQQQQHNYMMYAQQQYNGAPANTNSNGNSNAGYAIHQHQ